jgi:flagellar assembly protein FliH
MSEFKVPYAFDREFAADGTILREGEHIKRMLTEQEARALAECEVELALAGEEAQAAKETAAILKQVSSRMQVIIGRLDEESANNRENAVHLAIATAKKIAGAALDQHGADTIERCVREVLGDLQSEPQLAIRVAPHLADVIAERVYEFAKRSGHEAQISVRADDQVSGADCVLEWRTGAVERTQSDIDARIDAAVEKWLANPADDADAPIESKPDPDAVAS